MWAVFQCSWPVFQCSRISLVCLTAYQPWAWLHVHEGLPLFRSLLNVRLNSVKAITNECTFTWLKIHKYKAITITVQLYKMNCSKRFHLQIWKWHRNAGLHMNSMNSISNSYSKVAGSGTSSVNWITASTQIFADHSSIEITL